MKKFQQIILLAFAVSIFTFSVQAQTPNPGYNKALADSLGADNYGMKSYTFVLLKTGPAVIDDKEKRAELFKGHMDNINKMANEGKLIVAGPFGKNDQGYRGIFIFHNVTAEEITEMLKNDPTIVEKIFVVDIVPWYASAALPTYLPIAKKIEQFSH